MFNTIQKIVTFLIKNDTVTIVSSILTIGLLPLVVHFNKKKDGDKKIAIISAVFEAVLAMYSVLCIILNGFFTIVPNIYYYSPDSAIEELVSSSLTYDLDDFKDSEGKKVYSVTPEIGKVVKKNSSVKIGLLGQNNSAFFEDFVSFDKSVINEYRERIDTNLLIPLNSNEIKLSLSDVGVYMYTDNQQEPRDLGQERPINAKVSLFDFDNDSLIDTKESDKLGQVEFNNIPNGIYYITVICDGYNELISKTPFKLNYNPSHKEDNLVWTISLVGNDDQFYENKFMIKIVDENGIPSIGKKYSIRAIKNGHNRLEYSSLPIYVDKNGYVSLYHSITRNGETTEYYEPITFELNKEYLIDIFDDNEHYVSINNIEKNNEYIVTFKNQ